VPERVWAADASERMASSRAAWRNLIKEAPVDNRTMQN